MSASLVSSCSCLPTCVPSGLGCCSLVSGLVSQLVSGLGCCVRLPWSRLSLVSCLVFQLISGLGCCVPPPWSCLALVSGLVSQCVFLSKSLVSSFSCLWSCLPTCLWSGMLCTSASLVLSCSCLRSGDALVCGLGCCVRLPSLVLLLSPNLSPIWAGVLRSLVSGLVSQQVSGLGCCVRLPSVLLSPNLSPILAGVLRPPPWSRLVLVSGLVSQLVSGLGCCVHSFLRSCLPTSLRSGMLCPPSLVSFCSCLPTCLVLRPPPWSRLALVSQLVSGLGCCVHLPNLVLLLPPNLSPILAGALRPPPGLVFLLSLVLSPNLSGLGCCVRLPSLVLLLSPNLSPILAGVLRSLVSGLVSQQLSGLGCCVRLPGLVLLLSPVLSPSFLASGLAC